MFLNRIQIIPFNAIKYYEILFDEWDPNYKNENDLFIYKINDICGTRKEIVANHEASGDFYSAYYFKYYQCPPGTTLFKEIEEKNVYIYYGRAKEDRKIYNNLPHAHELKKAYCLSTLVLKQA